MGSWPPGKSEVWVFLMTLSLTNLQVKNPALIRGAINFQCFPHFPAQCPVPCVCTKKQEAGSKVAADLGWRKKLPSSVGRGYGFRCSLVPFFLVHDISLFLVGSFWCFLTLLVHNVLGGCEFLRTCPGHVSFLQHIWQEVQYDLSPKNFQRWFSGELNLGKGSFTRQNHDTKDKKRTNNNGNDF